MPLSPVFTRNAPNFVPEIQELISYTQLIHQKNKNKFTRKKAGIKLA